MKKYLIVGVGGSGGATLRYLMDQLREDLRAHGIKDLPEAWQFLQIDVNPTPERTPGLGSITELGGRYVSVSSAGNTFGDVRRTVEARLAERGATSGLATWEPGSEADNVPVTTGAGQFRAIGRMLTLTRVKEIEAALQQAWEALQRPTAWGNLPSSLPDQGPFDQAGVVVPIVVGSIAGGSGASMFLDVCRILGRVGSINRTYLGAFLFSPDVFQSLDAGKRKGIDGNAIGALGELIAAQTGAADNADGDLLQALGLPVDRTGEPPFGRVFPIGSFIGGDGARFGDTPDDIYRGLGRALAAILLSEAATSQYLQTRFENPQPLDNSQSRFGWGAKSADIAWASFGYASLSLGRDRYAEYVAQRLAHTAVDKLVEGFHNPTNPLPPTDQLEQLVDSQWSVITEQLGLAVPNGSALDWLTRSALTENDRRSIVTAATTPLIQWTDRIGQMPALDWLGEVRANLIHHEQTAKMVVSEHIYRWADEYATSLERRTQAELVRIISHPAQGLPYARKVIERLQSDVGLLVERVRNAPGGLPALKVSADTDAAAEALKKTASANSELQRRVADDVRQSAERHLRAEAARFLSGILASYGEDVLGGLHAAVTGSLESLDSARKSTARQAGIALLRSTAYRDWPEDSDFVPPRFDHAENEVLLTTSAEFPAKFREHVTADGPSFHANLMGMVEQILRGHWDNVGAERAEWPVIWSERPWRAGDLKKDSTGQPTPPSKPVYRLALSTEAILDRALAYQARKDQRFDKFSSQTFEGYLNEPGISDLVREQRRADFVRKFEETTKQARPLVGVSRPMISALHHADLKVELTFSSIPLTPGSTVAEAVRELLQNSAEVEQQTVTRYEDALAPTSSNPRIAVFGGYPVYNPLVFNSFLRQLQDRWARESEDGKRELWRWKRARPLPAALAMSAIEQVTLIKGWYIGRALGLVHQPADYHSEELVSVWSGPQEWVEFTPRLLTARDRYRDPHGFDWLAGVLEGHTLAVIGSVDDPELRALRPYQALRHLADDGPQPATHATPVRGQRLLEGWLRTGVWPSGLQSPIDAITCATPDPESRAKAVITWLNSVRHWIANRWLEPTGGFGPTARYRPKSASPEQLQAQPMFSEIALSTHGALDDLIAMVEKALESAMAGGSNGDAPQI